MNYVLLFVLLPFFLYTMDPNDNMKNNNCAYPNSAIRQQINPVIGQLFISCGVIFVYNENKHWEQLPSDTSINSSYTFLTQSSNRNFTLYYKPLENDSQRYIYALTQDSLILTSWQDSYKWHYTAINDTGTYVVVRRDNDFWRKKITYDQDGKISSISTVVPMEKDWQPCFFLNNTVLIAYKIEKKETREKACLNAWDIENHFPQQRSLSQLSIEATPFFPKLSCRKYGERALLVADTDNNLGIIHVRIWDIDKNQCAHIAGFRVANLGYYPLLLARSSSGKYIACAYDKELFQKDLINNTQQSVKLTASAASIKFSSGDEKELEYEIPGSNMKGIWKFEQKKSCSQTIQ